MVLLLPIPCKLLNSPRTPETGGGVAVIFTPNFLTNLIVSISVCYLGPSRHTTNTGRVKERVMCLKITDDSVASADRSLCWLASCWVMIGEGLHSTHPETAKAIVLSWTAVRGRLQHRWGLNSRSYNDKWLWIFRYTWNILEPQFLMPKTGTRYSLLWYIDFLD